tara:strand:- start:1067 stop:2194 length:1128 start_codon:yes stop_codon:yes gene_type:complete
MLKSSLLGSTILAGMIVFSGAASAGSVGAGSSMFVKMGGTFRHHLAMQSQDIREGYTRGYALNVDEAELKISASNKSDNGIKYGITVELNVNTTDTKAADEVYAYLKGDFGQVVMGDQDDVTDKMAIGGHKVLVGRAGFDGDVADYFNFGSGGTIDGPGVDETSDATKISYFSPRVNGFQFGVSHTPDDGASGSSFGEKDNDGDYENIWGLDGNYSGKFSGMKVKLSATYEFGESESKTGAKTEGDLSTISIGGSVTSNGFGFAAGFADFGDKGQSNSNIALGEDSGSHWSVGASYANGPYAISAGYFASEKAQPSGSGSDTTVDIISLDGQYKVAPGYTVAASINFVEAKNINGTSAEVDNEGTVVILSNIFKF